jgi:hypothetical protein
MLPPISGSTSTPAAGSFSPSTAAIGFKVDNEYSDPNLNTTASVDVSKGCPGPCGHHMRFWPVKDRSGALVPNTYLMSMDYGGINYDYQDNVFLITNIKPEPDGTLIYRLDVGGSGNYTDTQGRVWTPDTGLFSPSTTPAEGATVTPLAIANTDDDTLYDTYRGNVGNVPQSQRIFSYALPLNGATKVDIRLHYAERYSGDNAIGKRVFTVAAEGTTLSTNFDIFKLAPGLNSALMVSFYRFAVADGVLNLTFTASVDYPSIAAIEVYRSR